MPPQGCWGLLVPTGPCTNSIKYSSIDFLASAESCPNSARKRSGQLGLSATNLLISSPEHDSGSLGCWHATELCFSGKADRIGFSMRIDTTPKQKNQKTRNRISYFWDYSQTFSPKTWKSLSESIFLEIFKKKNLDDEHTQGFEIQGPTAC